MASAMISTTIFTVALIVEIVVDPVSTKKIAQDVNAKQETLKTSRMRQETQCQKQIQTESCVEWSTCTEHCN